MASRINGLDKIGTTYISELEDIPEVSSTEELKAKFDQSAIDIKDYLEVAEPKINEAIDTINNNVTNIENINKSISELSSKSNSLSNEGTKVYVSETSTNALNTSPKIMFSKTVPTTSNYGKDLPIGSIVFVYS